MNQLVLEQAGTVLDEFADLDADRAERLLAAELEAETAAAATPPPCRCPHPLPHEEGRCVWCGRCVGA